nr:dirigent protein 22-like [Tanacetum cinerariifolium]
MKKESVVLMLCTMLVIPFVQSMLEGPQEVEAWFKELPSKKEKVTKLHFYFHDTTTGPRKYNGSSLQFLGSNPIFHRVREMSIVGGTGVFRLARGIASLQTYFVNDTSSIVEYSLVVIHY